MSSAKKGQSKQQEQPRDIKVQSWRASLPAFEAELVKLKTQWQSKQNPHSSASRNQEIQANSTSEPYQGQMAKLSPEELAVEKQIRHLERSQVKLHGLTYAELSVGLSGAKKAKLVRDMFVLNNINWRTFQGPGRRTSKSTSVYTVPGGLPSLGKRR